MRQRKILRTIVLTLVVSAPVAACGGKDTSNVQGPTAAREASAPAESPAITAAPVETTTTAAPTAAPSTTAPLASLATKPTVPLPATPTGVVSVIETTLADIDTLLADIDTGLADLSDAG